MADTLPDLLAQVSDLVEKTDALVAQAGALGMAVVLADRTGVLDATAAVAAAIPVAVAAGVPIFLPPGTYRFAKGSAALDPTSSGVTFVGAGMGETILIHETDNASAKSLFRRTVTRSRGGRVFFRDLTIKGTYTGSNGNVGQPAVQLDWYSEVGFDRVEFRDLLHMATDLHFCGHVWWDRCEWTNVCRDGARARDSVNCSVTNCTFDKIGDDAVALHTADFTTGSYNPDDGSPRRSGLFVTGNHFNNIRGAGVSALSARVAIVTGNVFKKVGPTAAVYVTTNTSVEGVNPVFAIDVSGNIILDLFQAAYAILVNAADLRGPNGSTSAGIPTRPDAGSGAFVMPWGYYDTVDAGEAADAFPPAWAIKVEGNIIGRTMPSGSAYSAQAGAARIQSGADADPTIVESDLRTTTAIQIRAHLQFSIHGNKIASASNAILLQPSLLSYAAVQGRVTDNSVHNVLSRGLQIVGGSAKRRCDILIDRNDFNMDPYRLAATSNADGSYTAGSGVVAIDPQWAVGLRITRNSFQNTAEMIAASTPYPNENLVLENVAMCQPAAHGFATTNKGIAHIRGCGEGYRYLPTFSDPTQGNYGTSMGDQPSFATAVPTTGTFVRGHFVQDVGSSGGALLVLGSSGARYVRLGWLRLTTGSAHVAGTDWIEQRTPTGG